MVGCGAPVGYGTHETRACGVRESSGECGRVRRAWRDASVGRRRGGARAGGAARLMRPTGARAARSRAHTHYSIHNDMHAVKLASKTRFSFICAQFHMIHDILCDVKSRALRRSVSNLLCSFIKIRLCEFSKVVNLESSTNI